MGVAHAPFAALLGCDTGADRRPAAQSAARCRLEAVDCQLDIANAIVHEVTRVGYSAKATWPARGTVLPNFGSPTLFPSFGIQHGVTREREGGPCHGPPTGAALEKCGAREFARCVGCSRRYQRKIAGRCHRNVGQDVHGPRS